MAYNTIRIEELKSMYQEKINNLIEEFNTKFESIVRTQLQQGDELTHGMGVFIIDSKKYNELRERAENEENTDPWTDIQKANEMEEEMSVFIDQLSSIVYWEGFDAKGNLPGEIKV